MTRADNRMARLLAEFSAGEREALDSVCGLLGLEVSDLTAQGCRRLLQRYYNLTGENRKPWPAVDQLALVQKSVETLRRGEIEDPRRYRTDQLRAMVALIDDTSDSLAGLRRPLLRALTGVTSPPEGR